MTKLNWLLLFILTGCGTGSVSHCATTDWKIIGRIDEEIAYDPDLKQKTHQDYCKQKFNKELWDEGRQVGSIFRCSKDGAFFAGSRAYPLKNSCLAKLTKDESLFFQKAHQEGLKAHQLWDRISSLHTKLQEAEAYEAKKASQKSSPTQEFGRWLFNTNQPRSPSIREDIKEKQDQVDALEALYKAPYALEYPY